MNIKNLLLAFLSFALVSFSSLAISQSKIIEKKRSLYQNVYIVEEEGMRCMRFLKKHKNDLSQSCIYLDSPEKLVFTYYKQAMGVTYFVDNPKDILIVGLGGGILANVLGEVYPDAHITSVEIDDVVADMAKKYFAYDDSVENKETHVKDGRVFVKRALKKGLKYDLILLDAFNSDYIPEHMMTEEYLKEVKQLARPEGIIMANTFSSSKLFDHESATYQKVFGELYQITFYQGKTNRVIIVKNGKLPEVKSLLSKANEMRNELNYYGVDAFGLFEAISDEVNWDTEAKVLTDQYSPANLLKGK